MAYAMSVLEKLGLMSAKAEGEDSVFETRLNRIQKRETRIDARISLFVRNPA
jgi:hypothetical protein